MSLFFFLRSSGGSLEEDSIEELLFGDDGLVHPGQHVTSQQIIPGSAGEHSIIMPVIASPDVADGVMGVEVDGARVVRGRALRQRGNEALDGLVAAAGRDEVLALREVGRQRAQVADGHLQLGVHVFGRGGVGDVLAADLHPGEEPLEGRVLVPPEHVQQLEAGVIVV